jgi:Cell wall-active antibiotics response 4TMS YvqF/Domain of unknown function (DUF5668)
MTPGKGPGSGPNDWRTMREQHRLQHRQWAMQKAEWRHQHRGHGRGHVVAGAILLIVGLVFLLANLGVFQIEEIHRYWPVLLIVWGAAKVLGFQRFGRGRFGHSALWGGALMVLGGLLLAQNFHFLHGDTWALIWPIVLIFLGFAFLLRQTRWQGGGLPPGVAGAMGPGPGAGPGAGPAGPGSNPGPDPAANRADVLEEKNVFGGINRRIESQDFQGGHLSAIFGGIELDLRKANIKRDEIVIEADAVFGGIELTVPEHWRVSVQGAGIFGGYSDETHPLPIAADEKRPHLIITGSAVFGGVSVKN